MNIIQTLLLGYGVFLALGGIIKLTRGDLNEEFLAKNLISEDKFKQFIEHDVWDDEVRDNIRYYTELVDDLQPTGHDTHYRVFFINLDQYNQTIFTRISLYIKQLVMAVWRLAPTQDYDKDYFLSPADYDPEDLAGRNIAVSIGAQIEYSNDSDGRFDDDGKTRYVKQQIDESDLAALQLEDHGDWSKAGLVDIRYKHPFNDNNQLISDPTTTRFSQKIVYTIQRYPWYLVPLIPVIHPIYTYIKLVFVGPSTPSTS